MTVVLIRNVDADTEGSWVTTKAEIGAMLPQTKEYLGLPEAGSGKEGSYPKGFRGIMALLTS